MKKPKLLFLMVILIYICIAATYSVHTYVNRPLFEREIDMDIEVAKGFTGINIDWDALHFGVQKRGGTVIRHINLTNIFEKDAYVVFFTDDSELGKWVSTPENPLFIEAGESLRVDVICSVPGNVSIGEYTGKFYLKYKKA